MTQRPPFPATALENKVGLAPPAEDPAPPTGREETVDRRKEWQPCRDPRAKFFFFPINSVFGAFSYFIDFHYPLVVVCYYFLLNIFYKIPFHFCLLKQTQFILLRFFFFISHGFYVLFQHSAPFPLF